MSEVRHIRKADRAEKNVSGADDCAILPPELAEAIRRFIREELRKDRQHRRRALLAEVDSINRELDAE